MKTKKTFLITLILISSLYANCQHFYVRAAFGKSFGADKKYIVNYDELTFAVSGDYIKEETYGKPESFGKGYVFQGAAGYVLNSNVSFEIGFNYLKSSEIIGQQIFHYYLYDEYNTFRYHAVAFSTIPSFIISTNLWNLKPYISNGLMINYFKFQSNFFDNIEDYELIEYTKNFTTKINLGYYFRFGIEKELEKNFSFYADLALSYLHFVPQKSNMIKFEIMNIDSLSTLPIHDRVTEYTDSYITKYLYDEENNEYYEYIDKNKPNRKLKIEYPFSGVAFNIGIKYAIKPKRKS